MVKYIWRKHSLSGFQRERGVEIWDKELRTGRLRLLIQPQEGQVSFGGRWAVELFENGHIQEASRYFPLTVRGRASAKKYAKKLRRLY